MFWRGQAKDQDSKMKGLKAQLKNVSSYIEDIKKNVNLIEPTIEFPHEFDTKKAFLRLHINS